MARGNTARRCSGRLHRSVARTGLCPFMRQGPLLCGIICGRFVAMKSPGFAIDTLYLLQSMSDSHVMLCPGFVASGLYCYDQSSASCDFPSWRCLTNVKKHGTVKIGKPPRGEKTGQVFRFSSNRRKSCCIRLGGLITYSRGM